MLEGEKAVAGLPLLVRELAVSHGEELFVQVGCQLDLMELVVRSGRQEEARRRLWQHFITNRQSLQGGGRVVVGRGGKGKMAGGDAEVVFGGVGRRLGEGALEDRLGFGEAFEVNERVGAVGDEGGVLRVELAQGGVKRGCLIELTVAAVETGEKAGDVGVAGMRGVKLFGERKRFVWLVLRLIEAGKLGVERGVVGIFRERRGKNGFSIAGLLLAEEQVGQCGGGVGVLRVGCKDAAVGGLGGGKVAGGFGQLAGEEDVVGGFGGELEGGEEFRAGIGGSGGLVDPGERSVGAGFEQGIVGVEVRRCGELGAGFGKLTVARKKEAEREMGIEVGGVGGDGAAIGLLGGGGLGRSCGERVLRGGKIVEEVRVGGMGFDEGGEEFQRSRVVALVEGLGGLGAERILRRGLRLSRGVDGSGGKLGAHWASDEEGCGKQECQQGRVAAIACDGDADSVVWYVQHR